jgi:alpha-tubulin suppressor-like RCC1 family protein
MKLNSIVFYVFLSVQVNQLFAQNLSVGLYHTQYLCNDGRAMSWGYDCDGRTGRTGPKYYPGYVNISLGLKKVSAGGYHSLYLDSMGRVWSSGKNNCGQTGTGNSGSTPQMVLGLDSIIDISAGIFHSLFLRYDGTVYACGRNDSRQLGDGSNVNRYSPVLVPGLNGIVQVSAGRDFSLFVRNDGSVYGAGSNGGGKMGLGPYPSISTSPPVLIDSLSNINYASAGESHSLFVDNTGQAFFSGCNYDGQAGIGSNISYYYYPEHIYTVDSIIQVECENDVSLFLRTDSTVWICGRYTNSLVTGGTNFNSLSIATQIPSLSGVSEIGVGENHFVFEIGDSILFSMGDNHDGMLGDGSTFGSSSPVLVTNLCGAPLNLPPNTATLDENSINGIRISPNPATEQIEIQVPENLLFESYTIIDLNGQIIHSGTAENTKFTINISNLERGMYFLQFIGSNVFSQKIILN